MNSRFAINDAALEGVEIGARGIVSVKVGKETGQKRKADAEDAPQHKDKSKPKRPSKKAKQ